MGVVPAQTTRIGEYELVRRIGAGGMAEVYLARRITPPGASKRVALKRIRPEHVDNPKIVQMFCDEARLGARLVHPNIVEVVDFFEHEGELCLVLEHIDGVSCSKVLRAALARARPIPLGVVLFIGREVLRALTCAHEAVDDEGHPLGIVHRDVSPSNILVSRTGTVKLIDFGITRSRLAARASIPGELKGKLRYMSPEQIIGAEIDARSDLFALGIVLAEMLTGRALFRGENELDTLTRIYRGDLTVLDDTPLPGRVADLVRSALAHRPGERFASARAFGKAVDELCAASGWLLDDRAVLPFLHELELLPASGTRPKSGSPSDRVTARPSNVPTAVRPSDKPTRRRGPRSRPAPLGAPPEPLSMPTYQLRLPTGFITPAMRRARLLELIATGRLPLDAPVSESGDEFVPLGAIPSLSKLAVREPYRFGEAIDDRAEWVRPIHRATLPQALYELAIERCSGLLIARDGERQKRIYLSAGDPVFSSSTDRDELLGRRLVASGVVPVRALDRAFALHPPLRIGEALVSARALGPAKLLRELVGQLEDRVVELGKWQCGELAFVSGQRAGIEPLRSRTPTLALVTRLVRAAYDSAEIAGLLAPFERTAVSPTSRHAALLPSLDLNAAERAAVEQAPSAPSIRELSAELAQQGTAHISDTLRGVFIGLSAGLLTVPGWPAP